MAYLPQLNAIVDSTNSTDLALTASSTFTGQAVDVTEYTSVTIMIKTDTQAKFTLQWSSDGVNWDLSETKFFIPSVPDQLGSTYETKASWFRLVIENPTTTDQTYLRAQTILNTYKQQSEPSEQVFCILNSTVTPTDSFIGEWVLQPHYNGVLTTMSSDATGTLYFEFFDQDALGTIPDSSTTPTSIYPPAGFTYAGDGFNDFHQAVRAPRWFRIRWVGDSVPTQLRISSYLLHEVNQPQIPLNEVIGNDADSILVRQANVYEVMKGRYSGETIVSLYGRRASVASGDDIWPSGGNYTGFPTTTAENLMVVSTDANDTVAGTGARVARVYYYDENKDMFDTNEEYKIIDVPLNGTTPVNTGILVSRVWRVLIIASGTSNTNLGTISAYWETTTSVVFAIVPIGFGVSQGTNFTIPTGYEGYLPRWNMDLEDNNSNRAEMGLKLVFNGNNTIITRPSVITDVRGFERQYTGGIPLGEGTDIIVKCSNVANNGATITSDYAIWLVKKS